MSIPKEPRQLMINLMYLVLTALLALNVSAEVMNAFFDLDKSLKVSNKLTSDGVKSTKEGIQPLLDKKPKLKEPLNEGIDAINTEVEEFISYIDDVYASLLMDQVTRTVLLTKVTISKVIWLLESHLVKRIRISQLDY